MIPSTGEGEMMKYSECEKERSGAKNKLTQQEKRFSRDQ